MDEQLRQLIGRDVTITTDGSFMVRSTGTLNYDPDNQNYNVRDDTHGVWFTTRWVDRVIPNTTGAYITLRIPSHFG